MGYSQGCKGVAHDLEPVLCKKHCVSLLAKYNSKNARRRSIYSKTFLLVFRVPAYPFINGMFGLSCVYRPVTFLSTDKLHNLFLGSVLVFETISSVSWQCASVREMNCPFTDSSCSIWRIVYIVISHSYSTIIATCFL